MLLKPVVMASSADSVNLQTVVEVTEEAAQFEGETSYLQIDNIGPSAEKMVRLPYNEWIILTR